MRGTRGSRTLFLFRYMLLLLSLIFLPSSSAASPVRVVQRHFQPALVGEPTDYISWMPIVLNRWPPIPYPPILSASAVAADGTYTLDWVELPEHLSTAYTLQESTDPSFINDVRNICTTTELTCSALQSVVGTRYYRVRGQNEWGYGYWSDTRAVEAQMRGGLLVNTQSRQASLAFYLNNYLMATSPAIGWSGSHTACNPGSTTQAFRDAVLRRINYFRAMAGVPADITLSDESNRLAQAAALMMSVNKQLSHTPPTSWTCYSEDGKNGAGSSDLILGAYGWNAITYFMQDSGSGNYSVGHRRWILYPQTQIMGTGDVPPTSDYPPTNALRVFDSHMWERRPLTRDGFVAWPPPGYVPYQVVFARWSFSHPAADFSAATVTMLSGGVSVPLTLSPVHDGYGENTLVWIPMGMSDWSSWPRPNSDIAYTINIRNVVIGGETRDFTYTVTIFDTGTGTQGVVEEINQWALGEPLLNSLGE
jgi:uncharacterized protein YkwD